jgi:tetratricopeptide (TPR) repeat protein
VLERDDVLHALYTQGQTALSGGDGAAAVAALTPVVAEAPNAYPDAHRLLAVADTIAAAPGRRRRAWDIPATAGGSAGRPAMAVAATWLPGARAPDDMSARRPPGIRAARATVAGWRRQVGAALAAAVHRDAFPTVALGLVIVVLLGALLVHRGGSAAPPAADAQEVAPVPTVEADSAVFARCQAAVDAASWAEAIRACRVLHARAPDYTGLADKLAAAYVGRGQQRLAVGDDLTAAQDDFQQALSYQPDSGDAQKALQHLSLYQEGNKALVTGDWPTAVAQFSAVYADDPDYLQQLNERSLKGRLFAAWLAWGQSALNADAAPDAAQRCQQALALVPDDPEARRCLEAAGGPAEAGVPVEAGVPAEAVGPPGPTGE